MTLQNGRKICQQCADSKCLTCFKALSEDEAEKMPSLSPREGEGKGRKCLSCHKKELSRNHKKAMMYAEKNHNFQMTYQICKRCGGINDSRNEKGELKYRFCSECRSKRSEAMKLDNTISKMPKTFKDKRTKRFDKVYGIIE